LSFWSMTALLSIILAIMNLLPIPALDGGHALIAIIEMVSGKKLPLSVLMPLQLVGMVLLFALLIYANGMDVVRLFN
jgi:regulator of sigma E protease